MDQNQPPTTSTVDSATEAGATSTTASATATSGTSAIPWKQFAQRVFSDGGEPSSSRILTCLLAIGCFTVLWLLVRHICKVQDNAALGLWLAALPAIIFALIAFVNAPYLINRGAGTLSDLASVAKRSDGPR